MKVVIAGGHGAVARLLARRLVARGHDPVGLVRNPDHVADLEAAGGAAVVVDLEGADVSEVAEALRGADAVVFAAGAGPGSSAERKDTVDHGGAVLLADAAERAGVRSYLLLSSMGVDEVRDGAEPEGMDEMFVAYLRAKLAAEEDLLGRDGLDVVVLRPGSLSDDDATGTVRLGRPLEPGEVSRDDVAAVLAAALETSARTSSTRGTVVECVAGDEPVAQAVARVLA